MDVLALALARLIIAVIIIIIGIVCQLCKAAGKMRMRLFEKWSPASLSSYVMRAGKFIAPSLPIYQYDSGVIFRWREVQPGGRSLVTMDDHFPRAKDGTMGDEQADYGNYYNEGNVSHLCTGWAPILGMTGIVSAVAFASECEEDDTRETTGRC